MAETVLGERELARWVEPDFVLGRGCIPALGGHFEYESGGCQGFGEFIDAGFLVRFLAVFGAASLAATAGRSCWVTHTQSKIQLVEPLHKKDGRPFDVRAWRAWCRERFPGVTAHELLTGERPPGR